MELRVLKAPKVRAGISCFCILRNEEWILPHFLRHYRALGVGYFIFYDDRSTDRTREILLAQDDCLVLGPAHDSSPNALEVQVELINAIPQHFAKGWSVFVDADEFLILPSQFSAVGEVVDYLESRRLVCAIAPMIDFYPERLSGRFYDPLDPLAGSPWFDSDSGFEPRPQLKGRLRVSGGVRVRLQRMLERRFPEVFSQIYAGQPYRFAKSWKVPLLKTGMGVHRLHVHMVSRHPPLEIQLGLAHIKFYPDLDKRIHEAIERGKHYGGGIEYRFLRAVLESFPEERLVCERSILYRSPSDLEDAGLIFAH